MKNTIFITYFSFVSLIFVFSAFSFLYFRYLHNDLYLKYIPEEATYPQYSIATGELTNADELIFWDVSDYVPWYGMASYKIYRFFKSSVFDLFALLLYFPVLIYHRKNILIGYWIILAFEVSMSLYFIAGLTH